MRQRMGSVHGCGGQGGPQNRRGCLRTIESLEHRRFLDGAVAPISDADRLPIFDTSPYVTMQSQITSGIIGDVASSDSNFKVRIGEKANRSEMYIVGDTAATQQTTTDVIIRRMVGSAPANMQATVTLVDGNPAWWSASLAEANFQLGRAPTTSSGDVDFVGAIGRTVGDGDVDIVDLATFNAYYTGPGVPLPANKALIGINFDFDGDLDVDNADRATLVSRYTGPVTIPWNKKIDLSINAALDAPEGAMGRFQIVVKNLDTGETATTFAYGIKESSAPLLELRERQDFTVESDTKLAFGRIVNFDLQLTSLGADNDTIQIVADPIANFGLNVLNAVGAPSSQVSFQPHTAMQSLVLQVVTPLNWANGAEQSIKLRARSTVSGEEHVLTLKVIKADSLYTPDSLLYPSGRPHDISPGGVTTFGFTITNTTLSTATYSLSATPTASASGWTTEFSGNQLTLAPLEQRSVTMTVRAPASAPNNATIQWQVKLLSGSVQRGTNLVGTHVMAVPPKVLIVSVDGMDRRYFDMNAAGTGAGSAGDWLTPNIRAFMQRGTTYSDANSAAMHVTDTNHVATLTGSVPGTSGAYSVNLYYGGHDPDGAPLQELPQTLGADLLRYGPNGDRVQTIFDVAKGLNPNVSTAFVSNKGWLQYFFNQKYGGSVDTIVEGQDIPLYVPRPSTYVFGDPVSDADPSDPRYDDSISNWGALAGLNPSDRWVMDGALKVLDVKDPGVMYILLGNVDESAHAFGTAANLAEWDTKGTATTYDDVNRVNPRANREDSLDVVREVDVLFGQLIAKLSSRGTLNNTYVVLTADHSLVNHHPQLLDVADLLESYGYAHVNDYQLLARTGSGLIFDTAPGQAAAIENILETAPSIAPGLSRNPWVVLDRAEMLTGIDTATGRVMAAPGELYSQYYIDQNSDHPQWPELIILMDGNWGLEYRQFSGGEDSLFRAEYVGGHGGPATAAIPLIIAGPNIPAGQVVAAPVEIVDIAPTLYALLGWQKPANVNGKLLPGILAVPQSSAIPAATVFTAASANMAPQDRVGTLVGIDPQWFTTTITASPALTESPSVKSIALKTTSTASTLVNSSTSLSAINHLGLSARLRLYADELAALANSNASYVRQPATDSIDHYWRSVGEDVQPGDSESGTRSSVQRGSRNRLR